MTTYVPDRAIIHAWEAPESNIRFLEETLHGKDWRANILYPPDAPGAEAMLARTKAQLEARGYITKRGVDDCGHLTLRIHHLGDGTNFLNVIAEEGLVKGTVHTVRNPTLPLRYGVRALQGGIDNIERVFRSPAQTNGMIFTVAEGFLFFSGLGNKEKEPMTWQQKLRQPRNFLQSLYGTLCISQSLLYLFFARGNDERALDAVKEKINRSGFRTQKSAAPLAFDAETDQEQRHWYSGVGDLINKYPIQLGAVFNNLGMLAYIGHAIFNRAYHKNILLTDPHALSSLEYVGKAGWKGFLKSGFMKDIGGALTSIVAWTLLLIPSHKKDTSIPEPVGDKGILGSIAQHFHDNPELGTGLLTVASSTQRLLGAKSKENYIQMAGEAIYIPGDLMLLFTKNGEYGHSEHINPEPAGKKLADYIKRMPIVLGPESQRVLVQDIATYLMEKAAHDTNANATNKKHLPSKEEMAVRADALAKSTQRHLLQTADKHLDQMAMLTSKMIERFPRAEREEINRTITQALASLPWVHASPTELSDAARNYPPSVLQEPSRSAHPRDISSDISKLSRVVKGIDAAALAMCLHNALMPYLAKGDSAPAASTHEQRVTERRTDPVAAFEAAACR